ncbi:hypothetical protein AB0N05_26760 [Nocardia sp. NPDC051030]|uniref:hypothetical protein n=1 Tax=Nocardia sp. NPDC051030 TaxID=3155162 RepID=UPI00341CDA8F
MVALRAIRSLALAPGELSATVYSGWSTPDDRDIWTYASQGLLRAGQRELVLNVVAEPGDGADAAAAPEFPFWLMAELHRQVRAGRQVDAGGHTLLAEPGWGLGITGFAYERFADGATLYPDGLEPLLAMPLVHDEARVAYRYGYARVLAMMGAQTSVFPYPGYFDRRRPPVTEFDTQSAGTLLAGATVLHAPEVEVAGNTRQVRVAVRPEWARPLAERLREAGELAALLTSAVHSFARQRYVWTGDNVRTAIGVPQSGDPMIAGNFLMLVAAESEPRVHVIEDGYGLIMPPPRWRELLEALEAGREYRWQVGEIEVTIAIAVTEHDSPFGHYTTGEPIAVHQPSDPRPDAVGVEIVLLTEQQVIDTEITVDQLVTFCRSVIGTVDTAVRGISHDSEKLVVAVEFAPERPLYVQLATSGDFPDAEGQRLTERLNALTPPPVRERVIAFEIWFSLNG